MESNFSGISNFNNIIDSIAEVCSSVTHKLPISGLITKYMHSVLEIPHVKSISVYLISRIDFDIVLFDNLPKDAGDIINIDNLIDDGIIAEVFTLSKVIPYNEDKLIVPFLSVEGVNGLAVISLNINVNLLENNTVKLLYIGAYNIANTISYYDKAEEERKSRDLVDQMVASKTLEFIEDNNKLNERINELTSNLSMVIPHEIRTPINQILGSTNILKKYLKLIENEEISDYYEILDDIEQSTQRLKRITENYIYYANLIVISFNIEELEKIQKSYIESTASVIHEVVMTKCYSYNREKDIVLSLVEAPVRIDESYFIKIIEEIIDNSCKFSPAGSKISVNSTIKDKMYKIKFRDNGRGLSRDEIKSISPYFQYNRNMMEQQGSGLGLSIVYKLISLHNGKIEIKSNPDEFTEVALMLPLMEEQMTDEY